MKNINLLLESLIVYVRNRQKCGISGKEMETIDNHLCDLQYLLSKLKV